MRTNKTLAMILFLCLAVSSAALENKAEAVSSPYGFAEFLPETTMLAFSVPDVAEIKALVSDPKFDRILEITGLKEKMKKGLGISEARFERETGMKLGELYDAISGDFTFALLDSNFKHQFDFVIMIGLAEGDDTFQRLVATAKENSEGEEFTDQMVGDVVVTCIDDEAFLAFHANHFLVTNSFANITAVLESSNRLAGSPIFRRHAEMSGFSTGVVGFVNVQRILEKVEENLPPAFSTEREWIDALYDLFGLRTLNSVSINLPLSEGKPVRLFIGTSGDGGIITDFFTGNPVDFNIAAYCPADCDSFMAVSIRKPVDMLYSILKWTERFNPDFSLDLFRQTLEPLEQEIGMSLDGDLLKPLGSNFAMGIKLNVDAEIQYPQSPLDIFSVMEFATFLSLDDPDHFLESMRKIAVLEGGGLHEENYNGASIFTTQIPMYGVTTGFAVHRGVLIFSLNVGSLKVVVDRINSGDTLAANPEFRNAVSTMPRGAFMITYTSAEYLDKYFQTLFNFLPTSQLGISREKLEEIRTVALDFIGPRKISTGYSVAVEDGVFMEAYAPVRMMQAMIPLWIGLVMEMGFGMQHYY